MSGAVPSPAERFDALVREFSGRPGVTPPDPAGASGRKFGATALKVDSKIFAMLSGELLVVKLSRARVDALVADGEGRRFNPGHGRIMKEWFELTADSTMAWPALAQEALEHVGRATR